MIAVTLCLICSALTSQCDYPCVARVRLPLWVSNTRAYSFSSTIKIDSAIKLMTGERLDKLMSFFVFGCTYHMDKYVFECDSVHIFMCRDKKCNGRAEIFKERFKKLALYTCSIHNIFLGIYKV